MSKVNVNLSCKMSVFKSFINHQNKINWKHIILKKTSTTCSSPLIEMRQINVVYGKQQVFQNFNWQVYKGEQWQIVGANGSGKSTLVKLIYGNCLQVYSNEIYLFGQRRGQGESLEEIRSKMALLSPEACAKYEASVPYEVSVYKTVLSGFFDSIGPLSSSHS